MTRTGSNRVESDFEKHEATLRAHLEAALGAIDDGEPRMVARVHLREARSILNGARHLVQRDGTTNAVIPDRVVDRG